MEISWTGRVGNEEVLHRVKVKSNILQTIKRRKVKWIAHILLRNCLLKHVIEGQIEGGIEVAETQGRRRKQLLDDLKETTEYRKLRQDACYLSLLRTRFGTGYGPIVRQTTELFQ
jgi:hypothetical protein